MISIIRRYVEYRDKTVGIIAEYNPFHKGHEYHIRRSKEITGADRCIVVMSGDYVQRGQAALVNKYERAKWALSHGADLVLELPVPFCCASAEYFARGGVRILNDTGCVGHLSFGSECGDLDTLLKIAAVLEAETENFKAALHEGLQRGLSYPAARAEALKLSLKDELTGELTDASAIINSPNNVLALEYLMALRHFNFEIMPVTIKRQGADYHDERIEAAISGTDFSSATAIRKVLKENTSAEKETECLSNSLPQDVYKDLLAAPLLFDDDLSGLVHFALLTRANVRGDYTSYGDVSKELSNRIENHLPEYSSLSGFTELLKTKNHTYSRISRSLLNILLDIRKDDLELLKLKDYGLGYATVLGFRKEAVDLMTEIKENGNLRLITKRSELRELKEHDERRFFEMNLRASDIYDCLIRNKYGVSDPAFAYDGHGAFSPVIL